ncbi:hypothetical protein FDZ74_01820 [bacterium]|nr:MAG: hypothetical protein FDZ74_01820 [bacterium]
MEILGIGLPELALILVVVLLVLGPKDMAGTARRIARTIRALTQSDFWRTTREAWKMAQEIPSELLRETGLDEARDDLRKMQSEINQAAVPPAPQPAPPAAAPATAALAADLPAGAAPEITPEPTHD